MADKAEDLLFELEEQFWIKGAEYYEQRLARAAIMVFPDPAGVMVKDEVVASLDGKPRWSNVALEEHRLLELTPTTAVITYRATAQRQGEPQPYVARASSAYVHDGRVWRLAFHQQTPLGRPATGQT